MPDVVGNALRAGLHRMVRGGLRGVWLRGSLPPGPFVWAANHHSWWDPFIASALLRRPVCLVMDQDNLAGFAFVRRLGVFGSREPRTGLRRLAAGCPLVIFPEGELRPAGTVGPLAPGASWYAVRAGVPLMAVAVRVVVRGHQAPEAYVSVAAAGESLEGTLTVLLSTLDKELASADPREPLNGYRLVVRGKRSWDERLARRRP